MGWFGDACMVGYLYMRGGYGLGDYVRSWFIHMENSVFC